MITSAANQQIKDLVQLQKKPRLRREQGVFVVEGLKMYQEAPKTWVLKTYVSTGFLQKKEHRAALAGAAFQEVSDEVFTKISDTCSPQGILSVVRQPSWSLDGMLAAENPFLLLLENIQDPGNLGTMVRAGEAAGVTGILASRETVDLYNPKTIRSTMGSIYRVPVLYIEDFCGTIRELRRQKISVYAAHLKGQASYDEKDYRKGCAFLIGNEANGLSDPVAEQASDYIRIPMCGQVESLNAAVAASVLMYEAARQRYNSRPGCIAPHE